jgi:hypothetical protein
MHMILRALTLLMALLAPAPAGADEPVVAFSASVERSGRDVFLRVVLENQGPPVWAHTFLDFEDYDCAGRPRASVQLMLTDARQRTLRTTCRPVVTSPVKSPYRVLARGERITATLALSSCYDFERGEKLDLVAFYEDPGEGTPAPAGAAALKKRLRAGQLAFTAP